MNVKDYVGEKMVLKELKEQEIEKSFYTVKFSVNIDEVLNRRLKFVADELAVTRAELTRDLVTMALVEVEKQLNLNPHDFDSNYANHLYGDLEYVSVADDNGKVFMNLPKADFIKMVKESQGEKNE